MKSVTIIVILIISFLITSMIVAQREPTKEGTRVGDTFFEYDEFSAESLEGQKITTKDFKGKYVFVDFWATWCPPCKGEFPFLARVEEKLASDVASDGIIMPKVVPLEILAALLKQAAFVFAPSTGIIHLGRTVGTPVVGIYPAIPYMSPRRWGPYGMEKNCITPPLSESDPAHKDPASMKLITPQMVLERVISVLNE